MYPVIEGSSRDAFIKIKDRYDFRIFPAAFGFLIWIVIYAALGVYSLYTLIPSKYIPSRNNDLVFNKIGFCVALCLFANTTWNVIFIRALDPEQENGIALSTIYLLLALVLAAYSMVEVSRAKLTWLETLTVKFAVSITTGWLTAANIVQVVYLSYIYVWTSEESRNGQFWPCALTWIATAVFMLASWRCKDPIYGAVWVWTSIAVLVKNYEDQDRLEVGGVIINLWIAIVLYTIYWLGSIGYFIVNMGKTADE